MSSFLAPLFCLSLLSLAPYFSFNFFFLSSSVLFYSLLPLHPLFFISFPSVLYLHLLFFIFLPSPSFFLCLSSHPSFFLFSLVSLFISFSVSFLSSRPSLALSSSPPCLKVCVVLFRPVRQGDGWKHIPRSSANSLALTSSPATLSQPVIFNKASHRQPRSTSSLAAQI